MSKRYFGLKNRRRWLPDWRVNRQFLGTVCGRGSGSCATVVRAGSRHSVLVTGFPACLSLRCDHQWSPPAGRLPTQRATHARPCRQLQGRPGQLVRSQAPAGILTHGLLILSEITAQPFPIVLVGNHAEYLTSEVRDTAPFPGCTLSSSGVLS